MKQHTMYLDHAATTPTDPEVRKVMDQFSDATYGNPSSLHASGRRAAAALADARERAARCINASPEEIFFTGSGTESDNLAIIGVLRANQAHGKHFIISAIEHKASIESAYAMDAEGFEYAIAPVDQYGVVKVQKLLSMVREDTTLVSVMLANNELGTLEPVAAIAHALREQKAHTGFPLIHTDACQMAGHHVIDVKALGVDLLSLNGSKIYGPKGVGVLYVKKGTAIDPIICGGGQERGLRAGTESLSLISGFAAALEKTERLREKETARYAKLRAYFVKGLKRSIPGIIINGHPVNVLEHIVHCTVPGIEGESMLLLLDEAGIEVATGSACSARDLRPSHVLVAIGQDDDLIHGSIRFSFGRSTTKQDLDRVLEVFPQIVKRLRGASVLTTALYAKT